MISSAAGLKAYPGVGDYVAAEHGVTGLMRVMAVELGPHMIRVNSVNPGNVNTPLFQADELRALFVPGNPNPTDEEYREAATGMNAAAGPVARARGHERRGRLAGLRRGALRDGRDAPVECGVLVK